MISQEQNDLITRTGPKDACGKLMRMYWQPAALVDELQGARAVRPVKLLGENLVLFRDEAGRYGLIDRHCAHRGADLAFGRLENGGLRCAFHGWLFDVSGQCLEKKPQDQIQLLGREQDVVGIPIVNRDLRQFQSDTGEKDQLDTMDVYLASDTMLQLLQEKIFEIFVAGQVGREHEKRAAADQHKDNQSDYNASSDHSCSLDR